MSHVVYPFENTEINKVYLENMVQATKPHNMLQRKLHESDTLEASGANLPANARCAFGPKGAGNAFVAMAMAAYSNHLPIALSPDDIWLLIAQGLAVHIDQNAEELRSKFVAHEGKQVIKVRRDGFVRGEANNPWTDVFDEFGAKVREHIGDDNFKLITADFSTTGIVERAASSITLMDAMQNYFSYRMRTLCGFPSIMLLGTKEDWENIRQRVEQFDDYSLDWWTPALRSVLDEFVAVFEGTPPDLDFWKSFINKGGGSGGPYISGWISSFFPYVREGKYRRQNSNLLGSGCGMMGGNSCDDFSSGLSSAPFIWEHYGQDLQYAFVAGFVGTTVMPDGTFRPLVGWGVVDKTESR